MDRKKSLCGTNDGDRQRCAAAVGAAVSTGSSVLTSPLRRSDVFMLCHVLARERLMELPVRRRRLPTWREDESERKEGCEESPGSSTVDPVRL